MSLSICDVCKELAFESCSSSILLPVGLTPSTAYTVWIKDKHDHYYTQNITSDLSGNATVDLTTIGRTFTNASGKFEVTISTSNTEQTFETFVIDTISYTCLVITFDYHN